MTWLRFAAFLVLLFAGPLGCDSMAPLAVTRWDVNGAAATLPGDVATHLAARGQEIRMTSNVDVPLSLRGGPLSLGINVQWCSPKLTVDGVPIDDVERTALDGERSQGAHLYRIPAEIVRDRLGLALQIDDTYEYCTLFETPPTLARGEFGTAAYRLVHRINSGLPIVALVLLAMVGAALLLLYFTGGRRREHLWASLMCLFATCSPLGFIGLPHYLFGYRGDAVYGLSIIAGLFGLHFAETYFRRPPLSKTWTWLLVAVTLAVPFTMRRYSLGLMWGIVNAAGLATYGRIVWTLARHRRQSRNGTLLLVSFCSLGPLFFIESAWLFGAPDLLQGAHLSYVAWVLMSASLLLAFMRDFGATAIDLRAQLAAARTHEGEILTLSDELRHQVAQRSRELRDALVRTEGLLVPQCPTVGDVFDGRYRVVRELGAGGMGAVFEVERQSDRHRFALKVVTGRITGASAARFAQEAEIGARMKHPHLVSIVDVGIARGTTPFRIVPRRPPATVRRRRVGAADRAADCGGARGASRRRCRASGSQAGQRAAQWPRGRSAGQDLGLRHLAPRRARRHDHPRRHLGTDRRCRARGRPDRNRRAARHTPVHGARGRAWWAGCRSPRGHVLAGPSCVRDRHGAACV